MTAVAGDLHLVGAGIATEIAAKFFVCLNHAQTRLVGTSLPLFVSHRKFPFSILFVSFHRAMHAGLVFALFRPSVALHY